MDHLEKLKEWHDYYKARYEKAVSMNIDEGSKFYPAFKEIEKRYFVLYITVIFYEDVPTLLAGEKAESIIKSYIMEILKELFFGKVLWNEEGKKEYIHDRVVIKKSDTEKMEAYKASVASVHRFVLIDFGRTDLQEFASEIREDIFHIVNWNLMAREMVFPVNAKQDSKVVYV